MLGGLGESIANILPEQVDAERIGDVADNVLKDPELFSGLYNLFGKRNCIKILYPLPYI